MFVNFRKNFKKMQELAKEQGGSLRAEQIREEFSGSDLNSSQLVNVLKYLTGQGILIEGIETETEGSDAQEEVRRVPLTQEEEAYLKEYLESLPGEEDFRKAGGFLKNLEAEAQTPYRALLPAICVRQQGLLWK